jgi:hypothetical protein
MTFFRAAEAGQAAASAPRFWDELATGGVEVVPLVADGIRHDNMLREPYVRELADQLQRSIARSLEDESKVAEAS